MATLCDVEGLCVSGFQYSIDTVLDDRLDSANKTYNLTSHHDARELILDGDHMSTVFCRLALLLCSLDEGILESLCRVHCVSSRSYRET